LGAIVIIVAVIAAIAVLRQLGFKSAAEMGKLDSKPDK
jgi:hypothetical protein